jgi:hypothetical protein
VVVAVEGHRHGFPLAHADLAVDELGNDRVVAVGEDVRLDDDVFPDDALDRIAAAIDLGTNAFDDDARRRGVRSTQV